MKKMYIFTFCFLTFHWAFSQNVSTEGGTTTTGSSSFLCIGGNFKNTGSINTASTTDYATFNLPLGVGCTYYLQSTLNGTAPAGSYAGFYLRTANIATLLTGITIKTYLNNQLQESSSGTRLLTLLDVDKGYIYLQSTKSFNKIRIEFAGLAYLAYSVDIYYGFGMQAMPVHTVLPIFIKDIELQSKGGFPLLTWIVEADEVIKTIRVERSTDGIHFSSIAELPVNGTNVYSFLDNAAGSLPKIFYRIKAISLNGKGYYSRIITAATFNSSNKLNFNNPVSHTLNIGFNAPQKGYYRIELINYSSLTVYSKQVFINDKYALTINRNNGMRSGLYILKVTNLADGNILTEKLFFN